MKSIVAALALSVNLVYSAVPAPYPVLTPYSSANATTTLSASANSTVSSIVSTISAPASASSVSFDVPACPTTDVYSTSTVTSSGIGTSYYDTTTTIAPSTHVVWRQSVVATESEYEGSLTTEYTYVLTDYETRYDTTTIITTSSCTSTATKYVLPNYCAVLLVFSVEIADRLFSERVLQP